VHTVSKTTSAQGGAWVKTAALAVMRGMKAGWHNLAQNMHACHVDLGPNQFCND
jgi:hypothetical protein